MNKIFRPPTEVIEVGTQLGLLAPTALAHHAPRCVCGVALTWLATHPLPFDGGLRAARICASEAPSVERKGIDLFDGSRRLVSVELAPQGGDPRWAGKAGGGEPWRLFFLLHRCGRWNGAIVAAGGKK